MHPRPRPPQRAPSSRFTTLPTPLSPRRQRPSALPSAVSHAPSNDRASSSGVVPSPVWSSSIPPDTPPLGTGRDTDVDEQHGGSSERDGNDKLIQVAREDARDVTTPTSTVPFPSTSGATYSTRPQKNDSGKEPGDGPNGSTHSRFNFVLDDVPADATARSEAPPGLVIEPNALAQMSRDELEQMLSQADRIIREKEQELSVFTSAGEGLLQEYHNLRNRHENLLSRQRSTSGTNVSPLRPSRLSSGGLSPSRARLPSDSGSQRGWRNSLGAGAGHHRRISSGRVGIASSTSYVFAPSGSTSSLASSSNTNSASATTPPNTVKAGTTGAPSPSTSPTAHRSHRFTSSTSVASLFAPPPRTTTGTSHSAGGGVVDAHEVEHLSYQNYSLTQRVEELELESEYAEREGRKKLRRLERELLAMKEDLERSEGRNAELEEQERERGDKEKKAKGNRRQRNRSASVSEEDEEEAASTTFTSLDKPVAQPDKDVEEGRAADNVEPNPTSPFSSRFLSAPTSLSQFRHPGNGISRLRAVSSTSSLASLPRIPLFDPSLLDAQQDELFNQLIAKIDELQDANEAILEEREDMEEKLEIARDEAREWMGKCEDLEEQHKIDWEGNGQRAIAWLEDTPGSTERRSRFDLARQPESREGSPTPPSTARANLGRSLRNELSGLWSQDDSLSRPAPDTIDVTDDENEMQAADDSVIVHSSNVSTATMANLNVPRIRRRNPRRTITPISFSQRSRSTADDLVPQGTLATDARLDRRGYDDLANRAEQLEPVWADESEIARSRIEGPLRDHNMLIEAPPPTTQQDGQDPTVLQSKKEKRGKKARRKSKHLVLSSIRFGSDEEDDVSTASVRRTLALRRLGLEASSRHTSRMFTQPRPDEDNAPIQPPVEGNEDDDATSVVSSNYDLVDPRDNLASNDYYPVALRARYHPRMLTNMMRDSAVRHVVTLITWLRFLVVLAMALSFAVWQGPKKTLGLVDGRRRLH